MRRDLEVELYSGRLLPESRADLLTLIEVLDRISNSAENIVEFFSLQELDVPETLRDDLREFLAKNHEACSAMAETVALLLYRSGPPASAHHRGGPSREPVRHARAAPAAPHLRLDVERAHKLHLRDLVAALGMLSDRAEEVADMVVRIAVKRRF